MLGSPPNSGGIGSLDFSSLCCSDEFIREDESV
jgi:hypothetical protein